MSAPCARVRSPARGFTLIELLVALFITAIIFAMGYGAISRALQDRAAMQSRQERLTAVQTAMRVMVQDFTQLTPRPVRDQLGESSLATLIGQAAGQTLSLGGSTSGLGSTTSTLSSSGPSGFGSASAGSGLGAALGGSSLGLGSSSSSSSGGLGSFSLGLGSSSSSSAGSSLSLSAASSSSSSSGSAAPDLVMFTRIGWANPAGIQRPGLERVSYRLENGKLRRMHWPELDVTEASAPMARDLLDHVKAVTFRYMDDTRTWNDQWPPLNMNGSLPSLRMRPLAIEVTIDLEDWGRVVRIIEVPA